MNEFSVKRVGSSDESDSYISHEPFEETNDETSTGSAEGRPRLRTISFDMDFLNMSPYLQKSYRQRSFTSPNLAELMETSFDGLDDSLVTKANSYAAKDPESISFECKSIIHDQLYRENGLLYHSLGDFFHCRHFQKEGRLPYLKSWVQASYRHNPKLYEDTTADAKPLGKNREEEAVKELLMHKLLSPPSYSPTSLLQKSQRQARRLDLSQASNNSAAKSSFRSILCSSGILTIKPLRAMHLRKGTKGKTAIYVKIKYGKQSSMSRVVYDHIGAPDFEGSQLAGNDAKQPFSLLCKGANEDNELRINIGGENYHEYEILGSVKVLVKAKKAVGGKEVLGCVSFSVKSAVELCLNNESSKVTRWFPLMDSNDLIIEDGEMISSTKSFSKESETSDIFSCNFTPCIKLEILWTPAKVNNLDSFDGPKDYTSTVPSTFYNVLLNKVVGGNLTYIRLDLAGTFV